MFFEFNVYSSLLLAPFIEGVLFTILLSFRAYKENRPSDKFLAALIFCITLIVSSWMLGFAGWYDSHDWRTTFMFYFPFTNLVLIGPLFYLYFASLTNNSFRLTKKDLKHFILPAFFLFVYFLKFVYDVIISHIISGSVLPEHFGTKGSSVDIGSDIELLTGYASLIFYLILTFKAFSRYRKYIAENFSSAEKIKFTWLWRMLIIFTIAITIKTAFSVFGNFISELNYVQLWYSYAILSLVIYYLSIEGYYVDRNVIRKLDFVIEEKEPGEKESEEIGSIEKQYIQNIPAETNGNEKIKAGISEFMDFKKPYLEPELTLNELASMMKINRAELSKNINEVFGQNFNDFINSYRVDEFKKYALNDKSGRLNLLGMALQCGFNSKATFNRSFKKLTGITPKEYISRLK